MRTSRFFIATLKEVPAEAEIASHRLMLRAGLIRRLSAGIYTWLPLGVRVLHKVEAVLRQEMNRAGAIELSMPVVQPAELQHEVALVAVLEAQQFRPERRPRFGILRGR